MSDDTDGDDGVFLWLLFQNKEKAEEKGAKPKHVVSTRGVQAEIRGPREGEWDPHLLYSTWHTQQF